MEVKIRHAFLFEPEAHTRGGWYYSTLPSLAASAASWLYNKAQQIFCKKEVNGTGSCDVQKAFFWQTFVPPKQKVPNLGYILNLELI